MVEGAFSFLLFLFGSPQQVITNQLEGYWKVTVDSTVQAREWNRIYYFDDCSKEAREALKCEGHYGWAEFDGVYLNLYDKNYLFYGIDKEKNELTGERRLLLSSIYYDFIINTDRKTLSLFDIDSGNLVLEMKKVSKSEIRKSRSVLN